MTPEELPKFFEIDGKYFETNGVWKYTNRKLPVGQVKYEVVKKDIWSKAALEYGESEIIFDIPRLVGGGNIINLGDLCGGSAILLAQGLQHFNIPGHIYTIDCYDDEAKNKSKENMKNSRTNERITIIQKTTQDAFYDLVGLQFGFVFIDADHSYEAVKHDFLTYSRYVKKDGMVGFHDTNQESVDLVIKEFVQKNWKLEFWINRIKIFSRRII